MTIKYLAAICLLILPMHYAQANTQKEEVLDFLGTLRSQTEVANKLSLLTVHRITQNNLNPPNMIARYEFLENGYSITFIVYQEESGFSATDELTFETIPDFPHVEIKNPIYSAEISRHEKNTYSLKSVHENPVDNDNTSLHVSINLGTVLFKSFYNDHRRP